MANKIALNAIFSFLCLASSAHANAGEGSSGLLTDRTWNITVPIRVCTASIENFGARCNGAPIPEWDLAVHGESWCAPGVNFCGYDVEVWEHIAAQLGLEKSVHYINICMGELGFGAMIEDLARVPFAQMTPNGNMSHPGVNYLCDVGASSITANLERTQMGIRFSRATFRSHLAVMVLAPLQRRGRWAFFQPLADPVWISLGITILVVPFFVFFYEAIFSTKCIYRNRAGELDVLWGLKEAMWHSVSHTLSIDVFRVTSLPARTVTAAYAFLILILANTYTANLAAFLTVSQMDLGIENMHDLRGKSVGTIPTYVRRLYDNHQIAASAVDGWDHDIMEAKLVAGTYQAIISDSQQLIERSNKDETCSLNLLPGVIEPFDIAFAFSEDFSNRDLILAIDETIIRLQENGELTEIADANNFPEPQCRDSTEFAETNQVTLDSVVGLWIILGACVTLALIVAVYEYCVGLRHSPDKRAVMRARAFTIFNCGRRGNPNSWAHTESLRQRAKQDLPPRTTESTGGVRGWMGMLDRRDRRPHATQPPSPSHAAASGNSVGNTAARHITGSNRTSDGASCKSMAHEAVLQGATAGVGAAGQEGSFDRQIMRTLATSGKDVRTSDEGGQEPCEIEAAEEGSACGLAVPGAPLLRAASRAGQREPLDESGQSCERSAADRSDLPDPRHVLGTVINLQQAARLSHMLKSSVNEGEGRVGTACGSTQRGTSASAGSAVLASDGQACGMETGATGSSSGGVAADDAGLLEPPFVSPSAMPWPGLPQSSVQQPPMKQIADTAASVGLESGADAVALRGLGEERADGGACLSGTGAAGGQDCSIDLEALAAARGAVVAAAMNTGIVPSGDTKEELRRLRRVVAKLATRLDHMLLAHCTDAP